MALAITKVRENKVASAGTTLTPDSDVLASGTEYIIATAADDPSGTPDIPTKSGWAQLTSGTVFTQQGHQPRITLFRKSGDGSTNANATNLVWGSSQDERLYTLIGITGSLTGASLVSLVSAGEYTASGIADLTGGVGSFAMSATSGNAVLAFCYGTINGGTSIEAGYTALGAQDAALRFLGMYKVAQDTAPVFTKADFEYTVAIAIEIAVASAATAIPSVLNTASEPGVLGGSVLASPLVHAYHKARQFVRRNRIFVPAYVG